MSAPDVSQAERGAYGPWFRFTAAELRSGTFHAVQVEDWAAEWVDRLSQGYTYDELLDRLDGSPWNMPDGSSATVDLGTSTDTPEYRRLVALVRKVRREMDV